MTCSERLRPSARRPYVDAPVADRALVRRAATAAADHWGLPEPQLMRVSMNAIFAAGDTVLRASTPSVDARHSIELAETLIARGLRVAHPMRGEPYQLGPVAVTCWERIRPSGSEIDWRAVGSMVRRVHDIVPGDVPAGYPVPSPASFPWWHFDDLLEQVRDSIDDAACRGIEQAIARWPCWDRFADGEVVVCHGDVHPGNVMMCEDGPVLLDWDLLCAAPPGWDHAPLMTFGSRWVGTGREYASFASGYGRSLRDDPATEAFAELRLVAATLMRVRAGRRDEAANVEATARLRYWAGDPGAPLWRAQ